MSFFSKLKKTFIIAEIGPNHNGDVKNAIKIINSLSKSDIQAVKFQIAKPDRLFSKFSFKANYQNRNDLHKDLFKSAKKRQLTKENHIFLRNYCEKKGLIYLCSAFDLESMKFLIEKLNIKLIKIPSGEIFAMDIIEYINKFDKPILLSTGMSDLKEIKKAFKLLDRNKKDILLMHCTSDYPTKLNQLNLKFIDSLKKITPNIGFSDHTLSLISPCIAVAMGAKVIEKHVTFDKNAKGPDHKSSLSINQFLDMVKKIRQTEEMIGENKKFISKNINNVRSSSFKSIFYKSNFKKNKILTKNDFCYLRPGTGISPLHINKIIGKKLKISVKKDHLLKFEDFE